MPNCFLCEQEIKQKYVKKNQGLRYSLFSCRPCGLDQLWPIPPQEELNLLYQGTYFKTRTDRGYDNYLSDGVKESFLRTTKKNLKQLNFYQWERELFSSESGSTQQKSFRPRSLDVGCSAGYFVEYLQKRGWQGEGVDLASDMVLAAQKKGLNVKKGDFLKAHYSKESYDLITLWASLEHLPDPTAFIKKFYEILKPGGHLYISTCHLGFWAKVRKEKWRFLNPPEHIWFFSAGSIKEWFGRYGFQTNRLFTYGSGFTSKKNAHLFYKILKKVTDFTARYFFLGDMIVVDFIKECGNRK